MQTISKRELFITGWEIFKHNINFLVNIGILMFCMQVFIPMVLDSMFEVQNAQFFIYKLCYWILTTGLTLGIIVQFLSIIRDEGEGNINDIVNNNPKMPKKPNPGIAINSTTSNNKPLIIINKSNEEASLVKYPAPNANVRHTTPMVPPIPQPALYSSEIIPMVPNVVSKDEIVGSVRKRTISSDQFSFKVIIL